MRGFDVKPQFRNKFSAARYRDSGYEIKFQIHYLDKGTIKQTVGYFGGFAYDKKYKDQLTNEHKKYVSLYPAVFIVGFNLLFPGFLSYKLFKFPLLGIDLFDDKEYSLTFKNKKICRNIIKDINKHKQEILKAPVTSKYLRSIDSISIVKV